MLIAATKTLITDGGALGMPPYHLGALVGFVGWIIVLIVWMRDRSGVVSVILLFVFSIEIGVAGLATYIVVAWDWAGEVGSGVAYYDPVLMHSELRNAGTIAMIALVLHGITLLVSLLVAMLHRGKARENHEGSGNHEGS